MTKFNEDFDSICAISSPQGKGGVALIRISGPNSILIVDKIFSKSIKESKGYQIFYGKIINLGKDIDDVLLTVFKNPQSFTGEDTIEIRDKSKQLAFIDIALANKERETPEYIQLDEKNKKVTFVRTPKFEEVPYPVVMEPNLVIEYYSR